MSMHRALGEGYDAWKLASPYDTEDASEGRCFMCEEELGMEGALDTIERQAVRLNGKVGMVEYAHCPACEEFYSHPTSQDDLTFSVADESVIVDDHGKYVGTRVVWSPVASYDPREYSADD